MAVTLEGGPLDVLSANRGTITTTEGPQIAGLGETQCAQNGNAADLGATPKLGHLEQS